MGLPNDPLIRPSFREACRLWLKIGCLSFGGPAAQPLVLTPGWGATRTRKQGTPVGIAVASDGAIWLADDKAGQIIRIAVDRP